MSNKNLLNENTVRRFMKLAEIEPLTNQFVDKINEADYKKDKKHGKEDDKVEEGMYSDDDGDADFLADIMEEDYDGPIDEDLENFLEKPLGSIAKKAEKIELMQVKGLQILKFRERNIFDDHDDHGHDDHGKKDGDDDHDDHDGHEGHHHGEFDPHIWLDPVNAKVILKEMA